MAGDRYPVNPSDFGANLEQRLRDIEQMLSALANRTLRHSVLPDGSIEILSPSGDRRVLIDTSGLHWYDDSGNLLATFDGTSLRFYDTAGTLRAQLGYLGASSGYGLHVADAAGVMLADVGDHGFRMPTLNTPWVPSLAMAAGGQYVQVTSATFVDVYQAEFSQITHEAFAASVTCTSDAATTGEFRLSADAAGTTSAVSIPAASAGTVQAFEWTHGVTLGIGPTSFRVQARRASGAGNINVYLPARASLIDYLNGSATGL